MTLEINNTEYYLFGSYLKIPNFKDIDVLIVVPEVHDIEATNKYISLLKEKYAFSIVHAHIYIKNEYLNPSNKFSYKDVNHQITSDEFIELFKVKRPL